VTVVLIAIFVLAYLLSSNHAGFLPFLLDVLFLGLLAPSVEGTLGRMRFFAVCVVGGLLALAVRALVGASSPSPALFGACGVTAAVLGGYLLLHPRARVLTLLAVPFFTTIVETPAALLISVWLALQLYLGAAGLG
jgi:membrane associated rhomboid family serine protease